MTPTPLFSDKSFRRYFFIASLLLLGYVTFKAFTGAITNDEAYSFFLVHTHSYDTLPHTANTHWLNTLAMIGFRKWLHSDAKGVLRLLSVLSFALYAFGVYRFCAGLRHPRSRLLAAVALLLQPFLLDYFSLARGYGTALAFLMLGLSPYLKSISTGSLKEGSKAWLLFSIAVVANFTSFYEFACAAGIYALALFLDRKKRQELLIDTGHFWLQLLLIGGTALATVSALLEIRRSGDLQEGSDVTVFDTAYTLADCTVYGRLPGSWFYTVAAGGFVLLHLAAGAVLLRRDRDGVLRPLKAVALLVLGTLCMLELLHALQGTPFPHSRTAITLLLTYTVFFVLLMDSLERFRWARVLSVTALVLLLVNAASGLNLRYFYDWRDGAEAEQQLEAIRTDIADTKPAQRPLVFLNGVYGIYVNYYHHLRPDRYPFEIQKRDDNDPVVAARIFPAADYAIVPDSTWQRNALNQQASYRVLGKYPASKTLLVARRAQ